MLRRCLHQDYFESKFTPYNQGPFYEQSEMSLMTYIRNIILTLDVVLSYMRLEPVLPRSDVWSLEEPLTRSTRKHEADRTKHDIKNIMVKKAFHDIVDTKVQMMVDEISFKHT